MKKTLFLVLPLIAARLVAEENKIQVPLRPVEALPQPTTEARPVDPYAALKAALAAGQTIQFKERHKLEWHDVIAPKWSSAPDCYRIKPTPAPEPEKPTYTSTYIAPPTKAPVDPYLEALKKGMQEREKQRHQEALDRLADQVEMQNRILFQLQYGQK